ncbi:MAG TPA: hypothetical protein VMR21_11435 [Vicinamibacteria bacterium]|nr:hypothetical protein [Vicinamibacteria bacterium]
MIDTKKTAGPRVVERVQTGVRMEKRLLKVLKGLAELHDLSLGDLLEGIVLHAFEGKAPFGEEGRRRIAELKTIYGLDLDARDSHRLVERAAASRRAAGRAGPPRPSPRRRRR